MEKQQTLSDKMKLAIPLTANGLLKAFGGSLKSYSSSFAVELGDLKRSFADTPDHALLYEFEKEMQTQIGTQLDSLHLYQHLQEGKTFEEVCRLETPSMEDIKKVSQEELERMYELDQDLSMVSIDEEAVTKRSVRNFLASEGFTLRAGLWKKVDLASVREVLDVAADVCAMVRTMKTVKTGHAEVSEGRQASATPVTVEVPKFEAGKALEWVKAMWTAPADPVKDPRTRDALRALSGKATAAWFTAMYNHCSEPRTLEQLVSWVANHPSGNRLTEQQVCQLLVTRRGNFLLREGKFAARK